MDNILTIPIYVGILSVFAILITGVALGGLVARYLALTRFEPILRQLDTELAVTQEKCHQLRQWRAACEQTNLELTRLRDINSAQEVALREVNVRLEETRRAAEEKQQLLENTESRLTTQFENLAGRIFENNGRRVEEQNRQSLTSMLTPLREQLDSFRRQMQDNFGQEAQERHTLVHEIRQLQQLNVQMAEEALHLTNALKGNNKIQGNWGELVLNRVLEASGLREGHEYDTQVTLHTDEKTRMQPDVIVHLPQGKEVIIDAKMVLLAYERYVNSDDVIVREQALAEHIGGIRTHLRKLGSKDYQKLPGVSSLDYVLMFIPIESAFLLAINSEPALINDALKQNVMLVSPTTLLVALRTINNLWRYEQQGQNARDIAERASKLYDKLRLFSDDVLSIGHSLEKAQESYLQALKKLSQGRGNLIAQAERFRDMGVSVTRTINPRLAIDSGKDDPMDEDETAA